MNQFTTSKTIALILGFALFAFGCATNRNRVDNVDFTLTAEAVPEGILLTFSNIPSDTIRLFISVSSFPGVTDYADYAEEAVSRHDIVSAFADIRAASFRGGAVYSTNLEKVKQSGQVIFPIVRAGQKYRVSAMVESKQDHALMMADPLHSPQFLIADVIAENGIYFDRDAVRLYLNDTRSSVTLYSAPVFSSRLMFSSQKYSFGVTILIGETSSIGVGDHHIPAGLSADGLTWTFEPYMTESLRRYSSAWLESGKNYPAWATAYVNIIHNGIAWSVEVAKTKEFTYSIDL